MQVSEEARFAVPAWFCGRGHGQASFAYRFRYVRYLKRALDIFGAFVLLLLSAPIFLYVALLVKMSSVGPVIFRQKRKGLFGAVFTVLKFRTMYVEAAAVDESLVFDRSDPRLTLVGAWLRSRHLDDLPQLWNVLRGEMSLVGPRPHPLGHSSELATFLRGYSTRHFVKPGITGLSQVSQGREASWGYFKAELACDLAYSIHPCLFNDVSILWRTIFAVFKKTGI